VSLEKEKNKNRRGPKGRLDGVGCTGQWLLYSELFCHFEGVFFFFFFVFLIPVHLIVMPMLSPFGACVCVLHACVWSYERSITPVTPQQTPVALLFVSPYEKPIGSLGVIKLFGGKEEDGLENGTKNSLPYTEKKRKKRNYV
jgi:hypothetical protein